MDNFAATATNFEGIILQWAPLIIVIIAYIKKNDIFVTPEQLTAAREDLLEKIAEKYATKELADGIKEDIRDIKEQLTTLNNFLMTSK